MGLDLITVARRPFPSAPLICTFISLALLLGSWVALEVRLGQTRSWPMGLAVVKQSEIREGRPIFSYDYEIGTRGYWSTRISSLGRARASQKSGIRAYSPSDLWGQQLRDFIASRPVGSVMEIRYNPRRPSEAIAFEGVGNATWLKIAGMNGFFGLVALAVWWEWWRMRVTIPRNPPEPRDQFTRPGVAWRPAPR